MTPTEERMLIERAQSGDGMGTSAIAKEALEKLIIQFKPLVISKNKKFFLPTFGRDGLEMSADIEQEVRTALLDAFLSYSYDTVPRAKLLTHCENLIGYHMGTLNKLAHRAKRKMHFEDTINISDPINKQQGATGVLSAEDCIADDSIPDLEISAMINSVSATLFSSNELRLLRLIENGERKNSDLAAALGRSHKRVIQMRQQIKAKLRQLLV